MIAPARMRSRPSSGQQAEIDAERGEDEGEFADLRQAGRNRQRRADRLAEGEHDEEGGDRLADDDDEHGREHRQRIVDQDVRIEQHADRDEEQHGESIAQRQAFLRGAMAELAFRQDHAGEEGAERQRHAEELRGSESDAERDRQHAEAEEFARAGMGDAVQDPGNDPCGRRPASARRRQRPSPTSWR